jgi:8-oxo-dGTP pyrophosphatase MutT (NUDIX family)
MTSLSLLGWTTQSVIDNFQSDCHRVVVGAALVGIAENGERVALVLKRVSGGDFGNIEELPSGEVEGEETVRDGLVREIFEETGLNISDIGCLISTFEYDSSKGRTLQLNFLVDLEGEPAIHCNASEHTGGRWLRVDELRDSEVSGPVRECLIRILVAPNT